MKWMDERLCNLISELRPQTANALLWYGRVNTVEDILSKNRKELLALPNFGKKSMVELNRVLKKNGLPIKQKESVSPPDGTQYVDRKRWLADLAEFL